MRKDIKLVVNYGMHLTGETGFFSSSTPLSNENKENYIETIKCLIIGDNNNFIQYSLLQNKDNESTFKWTDFTANGDKAGEHNVPIYGINFKLTNKSNEEIKDAIKYRILNAKGEWSDWTLCGRAGITSPYPIIFIEVDLVSTFDYLLSVSSSQVRSFYNDRFSNMQAISLNNEDRNNIFEMLTLKDNLPDSISDRQFVQILLMSSRLNDKSKFKFIFEKLQPKVELI